MVVVVLAAGQKIVHQAGNNAKIREAKRDAEA